jgi:hypothetical protein
LSLSTLDSFISATIKVGTNTESWASEAKNVGGSGNSRLSTFRPSGGGPASRTEQKNGAEKKNKGSKFGDAVHSISCLCRMTERGVAASRC